MQTIRPPSVVEAGELTPLNDVSTNTDDDRKKNRQQQQGQHQQEQQQKHYHRRRQSWSLDDDIHALRRSTSDFDQDWTFFGRKQQQQQQQQTPTKDEYSSIFYDRKSANNNNIDNSYDHRSRPPLQAAHHHRETSIMTFISSVFSAISITKSTSNDNITDNNHVKKKKKRVRIMDVLFSRHNSNQMNCFFFVCYVLVFAYSILINIGPLILTIIPRRKWCGSADNDDYYDPTTAGLGRGRRQLSTSGDFYIEGDVNDSPYENPDYILDPCRYVRIPELFYFTLEECDMSRRLLCAVLLGGIIGYERRSADRPAGIRTMGLVALGACSFTISSIMAFKTSTMGWDASRVTAALPSGVGFLGGALIWKGSVFLEGEEVHQVHGLTTAASLWLSAAVGVGCGGALYLVTAYVVIMVIMILRYAPRSYAYIQAYQDSEEDYDGDGNHDDEDDYDANEEEPDQADLAGNEEEATDQLEPLMKTETQTAEQSVGIHVADVADAASRPNSAMIQSKSTNSLRDRSTASSRHTLLRNRSVRDLVPTFAD